MKALTLGVRSRDGVIEARLPIDTSAIEPGTEQTVEVVGYAMLPAGEAEVFDLPAPSPADRDAYAELATSGPMKR